MPTTLPRIYTAMERPIYEAVAMLAKKDGVSLSQKARDLLVEALEVIEDEGLEAIVERRRQNMGKSVLRADTLCLPCRMTRKPAFCRARTACW
ncbi:MAG: toxin-antitoxin system, antitoxin component [Candidatus Methylomirabilis oxyfera]|nr:toxin-antitoxin system, antitoxin component [Candidatus Methylomirabilis oxyfera]